jgi:transposase-like protein
MDIGKSKKQVDVRDRVALSESSVAKLDAWVTQVTSKNPGSTVNRKQLVNWMIESHDSDLSSKEEQEVARLFYDDIKFLAELVREAKLTRARGENVSLQDILKRIEAGQGGGRKPSKPLPKPRKQRSDLVEVPAEDSNPSISSE